MASASRKFNFEIPPRARLKGIFSSRHSHVGNELDGDFSITGRYLQMFDQTSRCSRRDSWTTQCKSRPSESTRQQPAKFRNLWLELAFIHSICMPRLLAEYFLLGFIIVLPQFMQEQINSEHQNGDNVVDNLIDNVWAFASCPLAVGISVLPFARLAEKFGSQTCHVVGLLWLALWSIIIGFSQSLWFLCLSRAMSGFGIAAILTSNSSILRELYPIQNRRLFLMILYQLSPLFGLFWGLLIAGILSVCPPGYSNWYFWIGSLHALCATITSLVTIPSDLKDKLNKNKHLTFDATGILFLTSGLFLSLFSIIQGPFAPEGWSTAYVPALFIIGLALLGNFIHAEVCKYATSDPLIPTFVLKRRGVLCLLLLTLVSVGGQNGLFYLWSAKFFQAVLQASTIRITLYYAPYYIIGLLVTVALPALLARTLGYKKVLIVLPQVAAFVSAVLLAVSDDKSSYWAFTFPSLLLAGFAFNAMSTSIPILIARPLPEEEERLLDPLLHLAKYVGITLLVAISGNIQFAVSQNNVVDPVKQSIKAIFWFNTGCAGLGILLALFCVQRTSTREKQETIDRAGSFHGGIRRDLG